jgi:hypothetical protein
VTEESNVSVQKHTVQGFSNIKGISAVKFIIIEAPKAGAQKKETANNFSIVGKKFIRNNLRNSLCSTKKIT